MLNALCCFVCSKADVSFNVFNNIITFNFLWFWLEFGKLLSTQQTNNDIVTKEMKRKY